MNPIEKSFGLGAAGNLTGDCPHCVCSRGRPQLGDCGENTAPEFWWSVSGRVNRRVYCSILRDMRTQDFEFPGCRDGTCTSATKVPAGSNTSIPVTGPILT